MQQMFDSANQLFVFDTKRWEAACRKDYFIKGEPSVVEVENGLVLPLRKRTDLMTYDGAFEGGVCDASGQFITGHCRSIEEKTDGYRYNMSCLRGYQCESKRHVPETVIFGGVLFWHFGLIITEGISRLWWFVDHLDTPYKIVFLELPLHGGFTHYNVLEAMGITRDRMEIIKEPTSFDKIIVPEQAIVIGSGFMAAAEKIYDFIQSKVEPAEYPKVYLSRNRFQANDGVNEEYFEQFYSERGYKVVYLEQLSFPEQVSILYGAQEVACLAGTLEHMSLFCKPDIKIAILNRTHNAVLPPFWIPLQMRRLDYSFIDVNFNFLPAAHAGQNKFLYGPTAHWKNYLDKKGIPYRDDEVSIDKHVKPFIYDYVVAWAQNYTIPWAFRRIHNNNIVDVIDSIHRVFLQKQINRKDFSDRDDVVRLRKENDALKSRVSILEDVIKTSLTEYVQSQPQQLQAAVNRIGINSVPLADGARIEELQTKIVQLEQQNKNIQNTFSWRITKPLRAIKAWVKRIFH